MYEARRVTIWEAAGIGAATGLAASMAPAPSLALLAPMAVALAMSAVVRDLRPRAVDAAALAVIAAIWAGVGLQHALLAALAWRVCAETRGWAGSRAPRAADPAIATMLHRWAGPTAALVWRASEAPALGWALAGCVGLIWLDWVIRRLADWRLGEVDRGEALEAAARQVSVVVLVAALPGAEAALAALTAMTLARKARLPAQIAFARQTRR